MIPGQTCSTCVHFHQEECRAHPPRIDEFPYVSSSMWCGEWEEQPQTQKTWQYGEEAAELVRKIQRGEMLTDAEKARIDTLADLYAGVVQAS